MNNQIQSTKKEVKLHSSTIFGILSYIFSLSKSSLYAGLIIGIIGIVKGAKCKNSSKLPLALSIIGTTISTYRICLGIVLSILMIIYYLSMFIVMILSN